MRYWSVWAVHLLTASGAAVALLAVTATTAQAWQLVFLLLGIAMVIDGVDGPIARALKVDEHLPWFDGARLDLVVDYVTYVFIPALVLLNSGLLSRPAATAAAIVVAVAGALYFGDLRMKTEDAAFRGFPAVWNAVVYLLMVFKLSEAATLSVIGVLAVLTFAPVEFVHPIRVRRWRPLTLAMTVAWGALALIALAYNLDPGPLVVAAFAVVSLYFAAIGIVLQLTNNQARPARH